MLPDDLDHDRNLTRAEALALVECDLDALLQSAARRRDVAHGSIVSYSRKVFVPLTRLCRDVCHYCVFAHPPRKNERAYLTLDEVLAIARAGAAAGCKEALFTSATSRSAATAAPPTSSFALAMTPPCPTSRRLRAPCWSTPVCCRTSIRVI